jgi:hypothetical protein
VGLRQYFPMETTGCGNIKEFGRVENRGKCRMTSLRARMAEEGRRGEAG